jgi:hypothetical protein
MKSIIDVIFDACVLLLLDLAKFFGITYKAVNVWIFCIIWPIFTIYLIAVARSRGKKIKELNSILANKKEKNK